jgi:hypothetical protein
MAGSGVATIAMPGCMVICPWLGMIKPWWGKFSPDAAHSLSSLFYPDVLYMWAAATQPLAAAFPFSFL